MTYAPTQNMPPEVSHTPVSLPAAGGAKMVLTGGITATGVHVPVQPDIYNPILDELATMVIRCVEKTE